MSRKNEFGNLLSGSNTQTGGKQKEQVLSGIKEPETKTEHKTIQETVHITEIDSLMGDRLLKEETHIRQTYLIDKNLLEDLNRAAKGKKKGFKTDVVNLGIKLVLQQMNQN